MKDHRVVSRDEWISARTALLAREKDFTRRRDETMPRCGRNRKSSYVRPSSRLIPRVRGAPA